MATILYAVLIGSLAVFAAGCVLRVRHYSRQPLHLRWELYPVPHEEPSRARHGGSYFEEADWWTKPSPSHLEGEVRFMVPEIFFLKGLRDANRSLWRRSYPFHLGLYLLIGTLGLVLLAALVSPAAPPAGAGSFGGALHGLYRITGLAGLTLALAGAAALLVRRLTAAELRPYTTAGDVFNLCFFLVALGCLLAGYSLKGPGSAGVLAIARGVLTLDPTVEIPALLGLGLILSAVLVAYIPFTHMSHFIGKYFTYHAVRWNDRPASPGTGIERRMAEYLTYRPTWSAPHVGADGRKTWAEVVAAPPGAKK